MRYRFLPFLFLISLISTCAEVDISVPGFPEIANYFGVSESVIQGTIIYNFLGYCLGALLYGPLSDSFGRRKMMLIGNAILSIGAIGCVFANSIQLLLVSRFIQGIGASTSVVLVFTMIADLYQGEKAMKLIGGMNAALSIIMACAPIAGGFINQAIGWRGNYGAVALFSVLTWSLLLSFLPESRAQRSPFGMGQIMADYKQLLTSRHFLTASMIPSLLFAAYMSYIAASAFIYMGTFALDINMFVIQQAIIVASFSITSMKAGKIIHRFGPYQTVRGGVSLCILSIMVFIVLAEMGLITAYLTTLLMSLFCIGFAAAYPVVFSDSLNAIPALQGPAASMTMSIRALLVSLSTLLTSALYNGNPLMLALSLAVSVFLAVLFTLSWLARQNNQAVVENV